MKTPPIGFSRNGYRRHEPPMELGRERPGAERPHTCAYYDGSEDTAPRHWIAGHPYQLEFETTHDPTELLFSVLRL